MDKLTCLTYWSVLMNVSYHWECHYISYKTISEQFLQWLERNSPDKIRARPQSSLRVRHFETLLHNFTSLYVMSLNSRTIYPAVTRISAGKIWAVMGMLVGQP